MKTPLTLLILSLTASVFCQDSTNTLFLVRGDSVYIPVYDDAPATQSVELLRIPADNFEPKPYRGRVILLKDTAKSLPFIVPAKATQLELIWRGMPVEDVFPHVNVQLMDESTNTRILLFSGFVQSKGMYSTAVKLPGGWNGKTVRLLIQMNNPALLHDRRTLYFAWASLR